MSQNAGRHRAISATGPRQFSRADCVRIALRCRKCLPNSNFSLPQGEAGERRLRDVEEIMAEAIKLRVPSLAEVEVGDDWGDVSKPKK